MGGQDDCFFPEDRMTDYEEAASLFFNSDLYDQVSAAKSSHNSYKEPLTRDSYYADSSWGDYQSNEWDQWDPWDGNSWDSHENDYQYGSQSYNQEESYYEPSLDEEPREVHVQEDLNQSSTVEDEVSDGEDATDEDQ